MIEIEVTYYAHSRATHKRVHKWEQTDFFCPNCGAQQVWSELGAGDYYEGEAHICISCPRHFSLPRLEVIPPDHTNVYRQQLEAISKHVQGTPEA